VKQTESCAKPNSPQKHFASLLQMCALTSQLPWPFLLDAWHSHDIKYLLPGSIHRHRHRSNLRWRSLVEDNRHNRTLGPTQYVQLVKAEAAAKAAETH
jgi:hypothetical protein